MPMSNRLKDIIYSWVLRLSVMGWRKRATQKKLLIVRVDEIGDFLLWHNFLKEILAAFPDHTYHFFGNQSWKNLFETFDARTIDKGYWIDKKRFKKEMGYRLGLLRQVYREGYSTVINPTFSRDKRYDDAIVMAAKAPASWGMVSNRETVRAYEKGYDKNLYTHLFDHPVKPVFEFYRNRLFTEFITKKTSQVTGTKINTALLPAFTFDLPQKYFVVFPGSRSRNRIWPAESFVLVSKYLYEQHGWTAVVCGTQSDAEYTRAFCTQYANPFIDLTGKTSLVEMLCLLTKAECLLSVDTGSVHMAAAVGCTVFGIFNGSQYKRFAPYPAEVASNVYAVYPDDIEKELKDENLVHEKYEFVVRVPYSSVKPEKVIHTIYQHYPTLR